MSDVIINASFVNKDSTKKLKSYQTLIGEAFHYTYNAKRLQYKEMVLYTAIPNH